MSDCISGYNKSVCITFPSSGNNTDRRVKSKYSDLHFRHEKALSGEETTQFQIQSFHFRALVLPYVLPPLLQAIKRFVDGEKQLKKVMTVLNLWKEKKVYFTSEHSFLLEAYICFMTSSESILELPKFCFHSIDRGLSSGNNSKHNEICLNEDHNNSNIEKVLLNSINLKDLYITNFPWSKIRENPLARNANDILEGYYFKLIILKNSSEKKAIKRRDQPDRNSKEGMNAHQSKIEKVNEGWNLEKPLDQGITPHLNKHPQLPPLPPSLPPEVASQHSQSFLPPPAPPPPPPSLPPPGPPFPPPINSDM